MITTLSRRNYSSHARYSWKRSRFLTVHNFPPAIAQFFDVSNLRLCELVNTAVASKQNINPGHACSPVQMIRRFTVLNSEYHSNRHNDGRQYETSNQSTMIWWMVKYQQWFLDEWQSNSTHTITDQMKHMSTIVNESMIMNIVNVIHYRSVIIWANIVVLLETPTVLTIYSRDVVFNYAVTLIGNDRSRLS
jgi:hypothetical protein